jgi:hypothetical protein
MRDPQPGVAWSRRRIMRRAAYGCWMASEQWLQVRRRWYKEWIGRYGHDPVCAVCYTPWSLSCGDLHHRSYRRLGQERFEDMRRLRMGGRGGEGATAASARNASKTWWPAAEAAMTASTPS